MSLRKVTKGKNKPKLGLYKPNNLYLVNVSFSDAFELFDSCSKEIAKPIFEKFVITGLCIMSMVQISISARPEGPEFVDKLGSYKDLKGIINSNNGRTVAACYGIAIAFPHAMDDFSKDLENMPDKLGTLANNMADALDVNSKRIKATSKDWYPYSKGEMGAAKGQMLSCPNTNINKLGIDGTEVIAYGVEKAIEKMGFDKSLFEKYDLTIDEIKFKFRKMMLTDGGGLPVDKVIYNEPTFISSKILDEIVGDKLIRNQEVKSKLEKGEIPESSVSKGFLAKYLSKLELYAYNIAIRSGDIKILKNLTDKAIARSKDKEV